MSTISALIEQSWRKLQSDTAKLDCELLLAHVLKVSRTYLYTHPEKILEAPIEQAFQALFQRRLQKEPMAYILGEQEFWSLPFKVTPDVLIPRPETELLVETALAHIAQQNAMVADLGTGSGAIACALAHERPTWTLIAVDLSWPALHIAQQNAGLLRCANVSFVQSTWLNTFKENSLDAIVSNPPYIEPDDPHLRDLRYEPQHALVAQEKGLSDIALIIKEAKRVLKTGGFLAIEHGAAQGQSVRDLMKGYKAVKTLKDLAGLDRVTIGLL